MNNIKMLIFDIDGTLIARGSETISTPVADAIHKAEAKGIQCLIATGRCFYFIQKDILDVIDPDYYVTINGQCLLDKTKTIIERHDINEETMISLNAACKREGLSIGYKFQDYVVVYEDYLAFEANYTKGRQDYAALLVDDTKEQKYHKTHDMPMGIFVIGDEQKIRDLAPEFPDLNITYAYKNAFDIFPKGKSKTLTIASVLKLCGLTWEEVMSFGDGENDVEMLEMAGIGVAMGNAPDHVKSCADYVTDSVSDDGIVSALQHFGIIE